MKHFFKTRVLACLATLGLATGVATAAPFTPGNIVVVRIGDGTGPVASGVAGATFLLEYTPTGTLVQTIALPTAAAGSNAILTNTVSSTSEAVLTRSTNGAYLIITGYDAAPGTGGIVATASSATNRVIGRVGANGNVDTSTRLGSAFSTSNIRSAASVDGSSFYAAGSSGGVQYVPYAATATTAAINITAVPSNLRAIGIYGGNLYVTSATGSGGNFFGITQVGTGLPTTASQTSTPLPGFPVAMGPSPYAFFMADLSPTVPGVDVAYIADDRAAPDGGIQKWSLVGGTWTLNGTVVSSATTSSSLRGLNGQVAGTAVSLVASGNGGLFFLTDNAGYNAAPSTTALPTAIVTVPTNTVFRGAAFAPTATATAVTASKALPGLSVSPNPVTDRFTVVLPQSGAATVALRDLTGRLVLAPATLAADKQVHLPSSLAAGVYLLEVRQGAETAVRRIEKN